MASIQLPIAGGMYDDPNKVIGCQTCINMYPEATHEGNKSQGALLPTPAMKTLTMADGDHEFRGAFVQSSGDIWCVYGENLYKYGGAGDITQDRDFKGSGRVLMAENSSYLCAVSSDSVYMYNTNTDKWESYADKLSFVANGVTTLAQRFIFTQSGSGRIHWTDVLSTNIDPLSYATAEASPDNVTAIKASQKQLWVFGETTTEIWYSTGDKDLPFAPMQGALIKAGCVHTDTIKEFGGSLVWLANNENGTAQVSMTQGYQALRISNHALEKALSGYDLSDSSAYTYQHNGHGFYVLNIPKANKTFVFDGTTQQWHERAIFKHGKFLLHPAEHHVTQQGKHVFFHRDKPVLMTISVTHQDEIAGEILPQVRERATHAVSANKGMIRHNRLTLTAQQGTGTHTTNPSVMLAWSDDGGVSWSDERWRGLGKRGQYKYRTFWTRLGASRNRAYRIRMSDCADLVLTGAELEIS